MRVVNTNFKGKAGPPVDRPVHHWAHCAGETLDFPGASMLYLTHERGDRMTEKTPGKRTDENRERFVFLLPKGNKQILQDFADDNGVSIPELILRAVEKKYGVQLPRRWD